jgi:hypothetical protein
MPSLSVQSGWRLHGDFNASLQNLWFQRTGQIQAFTDRTGRSEQVVNGSNVHNSKLLSFNAALFHRAVLWTPTSRTQVGSISFPLATRSDLANTDLNFLTTAATIAHASDSLVIWFSLIQ